MVPIADILANHSRWLRGEAGGVRANLRSADLRSADLRSADLRSADLRGADLRSADLRSADLRGADLRSADLRGADLRGANLRSVNLRIADLSGADLKGAYLSGADLRGAYLSGANLSGANLSGANLSGANLSGAKDIPACASSVLTIAPEGDLIVWKKARGSRLVQLRIPKDARRSNATGRKCRAEFAEVLAIETLMGEAAPEAVSIHDPDFIYRVGETVRPDTWGEDRWSECAGGIHFFLTRYEAENYTY